MKSNKIIAITLAAMAISFGAAAQGTKEQLTVPLSDPGKPYKLNVELTQGSIQVSVYDGKDVIIDAETDGRGEDHNTHNGMHRLGGGGNMDITASEKNNVVQVGSDLPTKSVRLNIRVPKGTTQVKLSTVNDGNITASDLTGDLEITNVNGAIKLTNVSGSVVANTVNGDVKVTFRSIDPKAAMAFTTLNGNVDVTFPASLKANVKLRSDRGEIYTDFDVAVNKSAPKGTRTAKNGLYRITVEDWITGAVNGGGPELLMKNMQGDIYLRKSK